MHAACHLKSVDKETHPVRRANISTHTHSHTHTHRNGGREKERGDAAAGSGGGEGKKQMLPKSSEEGVPG